MRHHEVDFVAASDDDGTMLSGSARALQIFWIARMNDLVDSEVFVNLMVNSPPTHLLRIDGADMHAYVITINGESTHTGRRVDTHKNCKRLAAGGALLPLMPDRIQLVVIDQTYMHV